MIIRPIGIALTSLLMLLSTELHAARTDIVFLNNGDRITGEVKGVYSGQLEFKTDDMGTIMINWTAIRDLVSDKDHQVSLSDGRHLIGKLSKPISLTEEDKSLIMVKVENDTERLKADDVVMMYPIGGGFLDRLDVNVSLGFNYDKSSSVGKYNFSANTIYRAENYINYGRLTSEFTTQNNNDNTSRNNLSGMHMRDLPNKRYYSYFGNLEQNERLGVDLRTVLGVGYGWIPINTGRNRLTYGLGIATNLEKPRDGSESEQNLEAVATLRYQHFQRSVPKRTVDAYLQLMPSLTQSDRVRAEFTLDFNWEVINDFYVGMELYTSYDSRPASVEASDIDFGVISSVGYSF
jgi:hypothetical protein